MLITIVIRILAGLLIFFLASSINFYFLLIIK